MADTTVIPKGESVVTVDYDDRGRGPGWTNDWARDAERVMGAVLPAVHGAEGRLQGSIHNAEGRVDNSIHNAEGRLANSVHNFEGREADRIHNFEGREADRFTNFEARTGDRFSNVKDTLGSMERADSERTRDVLDAVWKTSKCTESAVERTAAAAQLALCDLKGTTLLQFKEQQGLSYQIEGRALVEATKNAAAVEIAFKQADIDRQKIAAEAARQLAECCCEMKLMQKDTLAAIIVDGEKTRSLINEREIQDLRDRLVATQRLVPTGTVIPSP